MLAAGSLAHWEPSTSSYRCRLRRSCGLARRRTLRSLDRLLSRRSTDPRQLVSRSLRCCLRHLHSRHLLLQRGLRLRVHRVELRLLSSIRRSQRCCRCNLLPNHNHALPEPHQRHSRQEQWAALAVVL